MGLTIANHPEYGQNVSISRMQLFDAQTLGSQIPGGISLDEFAVAGGWMGEPVDLVRCETIDVLVPATSEIVLEGEIVCGERRLGGAFGGVPRTYTPPG